MYRISIALLFLVLFTACGTDLPTAVVTTSEVRQATIFNESHATFAETQAYELLVTRKPGGATQAEEHELFVSYSKFAGSRETAANMYRMAGILLARPDVHGETLRTITNALRFQRANEAAILPRTYDALRAYMKARGLDPERSYDGEGLANIVASQDPIRSYDDIATLETLYELADALGAADADTWARHLADARVTKRRCNSCGTSVEGYADAYAIYTRLRMPKGAQIAAQLAAQGYVEIYVRGHEGGSISPDDQAPARLWLARTGKSQGAVIATLKAALEAQLEAAKDDTQYPHHAVSLREELKRIESPTKLTSS